MQQSLQVHPHTLGSPSVPGSVVTVPAGDEARPALWPVALPNGSGSRTDASVHQTTNVNVNVGMPSIHFNTAKAGPSFFVRALWFLAIGWWLSAFFIVAGYVLVASVFLLPMGLWMLNRIPQAQTLRPRTREFTTQFRDNAIAFTEGRKQQIAWYLRLLYLPAGLVLGAAWLVAAWALSLTVIGLPLSVMMVDRAPAIITLQQN
ncbi:MAG TPA: hypothetical protein VGR29_10750 [Thermomicrobiales bacterium]|nr:hypothetical protein [Thermomicrobiales bacterium]